MRPPRDDDVADLLALAQASTRELGIEPTMTADEIVAGWRAPRFDRERHARVVEADGRLVANAAIHVDGEQAHGDGWVEPASRGRGIGRAIVQWQLEAARAEGTVTTFHTWASARRPDAIALMESFPGSEHVRSFFRMRHDAPATMPEPTWPDGIELRAPEGEALVRAIVAAYDGSFVDHWNFTPMDPVEVHHWFDWPGADRSLWFVAFSGDEVAGFCINFLQPGDGFVRGDLGPIGTTRGFRGIGLGRALLRHSVRALAARGATEVTLGVDTQNPSGAVRLYASEGFTQTHEGRVFRHKL